jgi:hypothetical protein
MFLQFLVFPPVARYYGVLNCLKVATLGYPLAYLLTPFAVLFPTPILQQVALFAIMILKLLAGVFAFPCSTILLTNSARSLRLLGTLNGVATSLSAIGRAVGPSIGGFTFTLGIDAGYVILPWWILAAFGALGHISTWWIIEMDGFGEIDNDSDGVIEEEDQEVVVSGLGRDKGITPGSKGKGLDDTDRQDDFAIEEDVLRSLPNLTTTRSRSSGPSSARVHRTMSIPIGMGQAVGPGGSRRLSNGLGQSFTGMGTGATSYH